MRFPWYDGGGRKSSRLVAAERDAVHHAAMTMIVVDGVVHRTAIVPKGERAGLPAEAAGELGPDLVLPQELQQCQTLRLGPSPDVGRVCARGVERLAAGLGMRAHEGMLGRQRLGLFAGCL